MLAPLARRWRGLALTISGLVARRGRIAFSTQCLLDAHTDVQLGRGSVIDGRGLVVVLEGGSLRIGPAVRIMPGAEIVVARSGRLTIGARTYVGSHANLRCDGEIQIGDDVLIAQFVSLIAGQYDYRANGRPAGELELVPGRLTIGDGAWIGASAVVLPDISVGRLAVIGAGAVVTHHVPEGAIVVGNPAHEIGRRPIGSR